MGSENEESLSGKSSREERHATVTDESQGINSRGWMQYTELDISGEYGIGEDRRRSAL